MPRPSPLLKALFDAPGWLYRRGLGRLLGKRFLSLTHRGRNSGLLHETVLEVISFDPERRESVVISAYGASAQWYRNIQSEPALRIRTGRLEYVPDQRFLDQQETRDMARRFGRDHRFETRLVTKVLPAIGAVPKGEFDDPIEMLASLPMVAFRPRRAAKPNAPAVRNGPPQH